MTMAALCGFALGSSILARQSHHSIEGSPFWPTRRCQLSSPPRGCRGMRADELGARRRREWITEPKICGLRCRRSQHHSLGSRRPFSCTAFETIPFEGPFPSPGLNGCALGSFFRGLTGSFLLPLFFSPCLCCIPQQFADSAL